ncbi:hypothetical protein FA13DRAFT_1711400 [Coprinellus micaceus]|uniref:Uncharacterized protein n=1 Tax=Coprinellus micaceus TaxID=71717 RepID=A0A4Y7T4E4_COPMI|nr:hypothetical protein FA13DRAFT_1711400 [Coprinellus micaceus]
MHPTPNDPISRPRRVGATITVGSAPHLRGYRPQKRLTPLSTGGEGSHHGEGNRGNVYGLVEAAAPRRNTATVGESTGVDGATAMTATEGDPSPWDTVTVMLMPPDAARAMERASRVSNPANGPFVQCWPINHEQTLVIRARSVNHWNTIAAVAKIEVLPQQRRFQLIFPSEGASEPSGDPARSNEPATPSPSNNSVPPCDSTGLYSRRIAPWAKFIVKAALTTVLAFIVAGGLVGCLGLVWVFKAQSLGPTPGVQVTSYRRFLGTAPRLKGAVITMRTYGRQVRMFFETLALTLSEATLGPELDVAHPVEL